MPEKLKRPEQVIREEGKIPKFDREKELPVPSNYSSKVIDHLTVGGIINSEKDRSLCWNELNRIWRKVRREKLPPSEIFELLEVFAKKAAGEEATPYRSIKYPDEIGRYGDALIEIKKGVLKEYLPTNYALKLAIQSFRKAGIIKTKEEEIQCREKLLVLQQKIQKKLEQEFKNLKYSSSLYNLEKDGEEFIRLNRRNLIFFSEILGYLAKGGAIKSPDDVTKCGNEVINLDLNPDSMLLTDLLRSLDKAGLMKSTEDLKGWVYEIDNLAKLKSKMNEYPMDNGIFTAIPQVLHSLVDGGFIKSTEDLRKYGNEIARLSNHEDELRTLLQTFNQLVVSGVIKKPVLFPTDDEAHYRNELLRLHMTTKDANISEEYYFKLLRSVIRKGGIKSTKDIVDYDNVIKSLLKNASTAHYEHPFSVNNSILEGCASLVEKGLIKSREDLENYGIELVKLAESMKNARAEGFINPLFETHLGSLVESGVLKSLEGVSELAKLVEKAEKSDIDPYGLLFNPLRGLAKAGLVNSPKDISTYGGELIRLSESVRKAGIKQLWLYSFEVAELAEFGVVKSLEDMASCVDILVKLAESMKKAGMDEFSTTRLASLAELKVIKTPEDVNSFITDLSKNIHIVDYIGYFTDEELSQLKPQNFSAQLVELGVKKIAEWVDFPLEKITQTQKEQLAKMLPGLGFILQNQEVRTLVKHGLENTFQKFYDSLEENKQALKEMNKLGIDTDVFVYHKGIDKAVFKKTLTGIEKLEAGEEHIEDRFYDVINQLFNNPKGEIFKKPGRILSDVMQLQQFDARDYQTGEERVGILIAMMKSDEEWLKGAISVLETHLKTVGQQGSVVVDSEEMKQEARTALFHVQEIKRLLGMPVKPMKGEKGEITISIKLSDKNPLTALTNGNDSGCCVALNGNNSWTLPIYMKDMATQIAEIFVIRGGKEQRIGQAWLFAGAALLPKKAVEAESEKESVLIIDSINITSSYRNMNEIYEASIEFVKDFAEKAGFKNIIMGTNYNDAYPYAEEKFERKIMELEKIHTFNEKIYSDTLSSGIRNNVDVFVIK